MGEYLFTGLSPMPDDITHMLKVKPKLLERKTIRERIIQKIRDFIDTYINGISDESGDQQVNEAKVYPIGDHPESMAAEE